MDLVTDWFPGVHPTLDGHLCLQRRREDGVLVQLGNRLGSRPAVEAFLTREQATKVATHLKRTARAAE